MGTNGGSNRAQSVAVTAQSVAVAEAQQAAVTDHNQPKELSNLRLQVYLGSNCVCQAMTVKGMNASIVCCQFRAANRVYGWFITMKYCENSAYCMILYITPSYPSLLSELSNARSCCNEILTNDSSDTKASGCLYSPGLGVM